MLIDRLTRPQIDRMRAAGRVARATLDAVGAQLRAGMSTGEVDRLVRIDTERRGARPSQLGYHGFPGAVCTSRNDVICHGIPREDERLESGDVISLDVTSELDGWHGDNCATFLIGDPKKEARHVTEVARRARDVGVSAVRDGVRIGDVGAVIEELVTREGCGVVHEFGGHGIGRRMHLPPHIAHHGPRGQGRRLRAGMAITIEPIITIGTPRVKVDADGWTVRTSDGSPSAQFEHTVLVTKTGAEILTRD